MGRKKKTDYPKEGKKQSTAKLVKNHYETLKHLGVDRLKQTDTKQSFEELLQAAAIPAQP